MEEISNSHALDEDALKVVDLHNISSFLPISDVADEEIDIFNMASLRNLMLVGKHNRQNTLNRHPDPNNDYAEEDDKLQRLSLAYERLHSIPKLLLQELAHVVRILDISYNEFDNLDFLSEFKFLTTLICDHNVISSNTNIPYMPKLELLWMNHCKVATLYPWAKKLQLSCPNLKYLSLMGNPVAPSYLNGGNFYEYLQYRLFIISLFPNLIHLDDRPVTSDQRKEAERLYRKPLVERLVMKTQATLPVYLRQLSDAVSDILTPTPSFAPTPEKNVIV
ncbi:leucine-rich repeat-containing protein ODA7 [Asbolus verrucosus]|uniref:Leucine-rich repeat-containing protein ODA7 n=1 Tax=Asbolus verrucosus TaxID=1661398 RepID=A0A482W4W5_ASBVE|nr:leucine-rich repeat-containing protein ODA7 [Asbolus verrucosus]